ncbi:unnamed protein product [Chilo suppressalis]|uniref:Uncharacterized protein n=1 Tax=Chilo suppressalis TaxID=168631 RepID=A0ABN8BCL3_CHISP|nr:unnamed protein product [Chilo suppressalis]
MMFMVLALCVYAVSGATIGNTAFNPRRTPDVVRTTQTGGYGKATAQVTVPATQVFQETVNPAIKVAKAGEQPVQQVAKLTIPIVQQAKFSGPVIQFRVATNARQSGNKTTNVPDIKAETLQSENKVFHNSFQYSYETSNGISAASNGELRKVDNADSLIVRGNYQYVSREGVPITVTYVADENGYQPQTGYLLESD